MSVEKTQYRICAYICTKSDFHSQYTISLRKNFRNQINHSVCDTKFFARKKNETW